MCWAVDCASTQGTQKLRNSKVSLFYWWVLPRGFQLRKPIVMGGTFMYFQGSLLRSMTLTVSQDIALSCLIVPHRRHTRRFGNHILKFSAEAMTTRMFHVLRCVSTLPEYIHSYLYSCTTLSLLCLCHFFFLLSDSHSTVQQGTHSPCVKIRALLFHPQTIA